MTSHDYLVEMTFSPFGSLLTPEEVATFTERFVLPTLETCQKLVASGRIVAGGPALASIGFLFIARVGSPQELEDMVGGLPLWSRAQTRVVPLGTFDARTATVRDRFTRLQARPAASPPSSSAVSARN